jgi:hypothetical protein
MRPPRGSRSPAALPPRCPAALPPRCPTAPPPDLPSAALFASITLMGPSSRRFVAALVRIGLVVLAIAIVSGYVMRRTGKHRVRVQVEAPAPEALAPGDLRIFNRDSSVDLVLQGDRILAGLSPKTIEKVRGELEASAAKETSGLGASISKAVKSSVAGAIGMHAVFRLDDMRDIRLDGDRIVVVWKAGGRQDVFGSSKVDGHEVSGSFAREDAERFVQAVRARMGLPAEQ